MLILHLTLESSRQTRLGYISLIAVIPSVISDACICLRLLVLPPSRFHQSANGAPFAVSPPDLRCRICRSFPIPRPHRLCFYRYDVIASFCCACGSSPYTSTILPRYIIKSISLIGIPRGTPLLFITVSPILPLCVCCNIVSLCPIRRCLIAPQWDPFP